MKMCCGYPCYRAWQDHWLLISVTDISHWEDEDVRCGGALYTNLQEAAGGQRRHTDGSVNSHWATYKAFSLDCCP